MSYPKYKHTKPEADRETLERMYHEEDMSLREVGDEFGRSHGTIRNWMHYYDIPLRPRGRTRGLEDPTKLLDALKDRRPEPTTTREIADLLDVSIKGAHNYLDDLESSHPNVHSKRVGATAFAWWYEDEGNDE